MIRRRKMMRRRITAIARHTPIRSGLQPQILWQAAKRSWDDEHIARVRRLRQQEIVDVRRIRAAGDVRPRNILHHDEENSLNVREAPCVNDAKAE